MKKNHWTTEFKVGLFIVFCAVGLLYMTYSTGKLDFRTKGYLVDVIFDEAAGLGKKAPVMLNGLEVGKVQTIKPIYKDHRTKIKLQLWLQDHAKIRQGSEISIKMMGLMGEKYIHIASSNNEEFAQPGEVLKGQPYVDLDVFIRNLNSTVEENRQNIAQAIEGLNQLLVHADEVVTSNQDGLKRTIQNFEMTSQNFEEFSDDLKRNPWKLLFRTKEKPRADYCFPKE